MPLKALLAVLLVSLLGCSIIGYESIGGDPNNPTERRILSFQGIGSLCFRGLTVMGAGLQGFAWGDVECDPAPPEDD